jgi:NADH-quinone oxidoreductase subunit L
MFVGWELVGLSSYLLIGYYHQDAANMTAANKAFMVNRVGDFGYIMGLALLFLALDGTGYTFETIKAHIGLVDHTLLTLIGVLLFVGAMGKSAQIPLYVWLPDAMAGPTPVSALIHAATMVTAGVYMVARFSFLYNEVPAVGEFIAIIGAASALFAAIIASYQSDIKKILAYSTMSQLGYMFIAVGLGAYSFGIFHVFTHAMFKALLFMGAGAVIIALHHEQDIFKMGGLKRLLPAVYLLMLIGTLTISGIPPFSAFFSKDAIINYSFLNGNYLLWIMGVLTALLTAFYMFRMFFIVFHANQEKHYDHLVPLPSMMIWPLIILAVGATFAGLFNLPHAFGGDELFSHFLALPEHLHHTTNINEYLLDTVNVGAAVIGVWLAYRFYATEAKAPEATGFWRKTVMNKFYVDELYAWLIIKPLLWMSRFAEQVVDTKVVDGFINGTVLGYRKAGYYFALLQNGKVRYYALYILAGVAMIALAMLQVLGGL